MQYTYRLFTTLLGGLLLLFLTSASVAPDATPPAEKEASKKEQRFQKRQAAKLERLNQRLAKAKNDKTKARLQFKIQQTQVQQAESAGDIEILSVVALIFAFLLPPLGLILAIIAKNRGGGLIAEIAFWVGLVLTVLWLVYFITGGWWGWR